MQPVQDPAQSARLVYRPAESPQDDTFFQTINNDRVGYMNSNGANALLSNNANAKRFQDYVSGKALLGAVICLPPSSSSDAATSPDIKEGTSEKPKPTPIGCIHLQPSSPEMAHHRHTEIGIDILPEWQGKGYGGEAISWVLDWAFDRLNLHKVMIRAFEYNEGAIRLYERIGFSREGRWKEYLWHDGRYWDDIQLGMLAREWKEIKNNRAQS
ncbi:acyl-CoA N-acyltransferase [Elsinoe ampelina]|uniref:Acyl-CoA N-acyltransferase n=1 Tax=Elsinoe ampelina TaxID=302913 RepID=A0A6A6GIQ2_9PEZI|nr:acyl-CoA N-acyltransferase [Elsinoe ampelina]